MSCLVWVTSVQGWGSPCAMNSWVRRSSCSETGFTAGLCIMYTCILCFRTGRRERAREREVRVGPFAPRPLMYVEAWDHWAVHVQCDTVYISIYIVAETGQ